MKQIIPILAIGFLSLLPITSFGSTTKEIVCSPFSGYCLGFDNHNLQIFDTTNATLATFNTSQCSNGQMTKYQSSNNTWICTPNTSGISSLNSDTTASQTI